MNCPEEIWITDTTFRDGQQSRSPYTEEQIVELFKMLHKLGGDKGIIRQSEFFLYSEKDRKAVEMCQNLGYDFPEVTSWIRANENDFQLVKSMNILIVGFMLCYQSAEEMSEWKAHIQGTEPAASKTF